jgi:putative IMPACT (imprinted ancient) family translation regulator
VEEFKNHLQQLKKDHPKAVHHCFAYRIGLDGNNFRVSDDGEPAGTAGKTNTWTNRQQGTNQHTCYCSTIILAVLYWECLVLLNAYKSATSMALQLTTIIAKAVEANYMLQFDYANE